MKIYFPLYCLLHKNRHSCFYNLYIKRFVFIKTVNLNTTQKDVTKPSRVCIYVEANPLKQTLYLSPPFFARVRYSFKQQPPSPWDRSIQYSFALKMPLRIPNLYL